MKFTDPDLNARLDRVEQILEHIGPKVLGDSLNPVTMNPWFEFSGQDAMVTIPTVHIGFEDKELVTLAEALTSLRRAVDSLRRDLEDMKNDKG